MPVTENQDNVHVKKVLMGKIVIFVHLDTTVYQMLVARNVYVLQLDLLTIYVMILMEFVSVTQVSLVIFVTGVQTTFLISQQVVYLATVHMLVL